MSSIRQAGMVKRIFRAAGYLVPVALYAMYSLGAGHSYGSLWLKILLGAILALFAASLLLRSWPVGAGAYFTFGVLIASASGFEGFGWLGLVFIPYVFLAAVIFGTWGAVGFALAVPMFEARHLMLDGVAAEDWAVMGLAALAGGLALVAVIKKNTPDIARKPRFGPKITDVPSNDDDDIAAPPVNMDGLMREDDEALRELLRIVVFATRASAVSLFIRREDELRLRCSSIGQPAAGGGRISPVPRWYANDVLRLRHTIVTGNLGAETTQGFVNRAAPMDKGGSLPEDAGTYNNMAQRDSEAVSIAAAPVLEGSMVAGVLAVSSPRSNAFRGNSVTVLELISAQVARTLAGGRVYAETERDSQNLRLVYEESARLVSSIDLKEINAILADVMGRISGLDVHIYIRTPSGFALTFESGPSPSRAGHVDMRGTLADMEAGEGETMYISSLRGYTTPVIPNQGEREFAAALLMPLVCGGEVMGLVVLTSERKDPLTAETIERLKMVSRQAGISLKNTMLHAEVKVKAVTDALTGLNNRRRFMEQLGAEHDRFMRTGMPYAVVMMDLDHFKDVNDTWGHQAGDDVLREVSSRMRSVFRATDTIGRYGGEEFAAVLVDSDARGAVGQADRMRKAIESSAVDIGEQREINVTMSLGVALSDPQAGPEEVMKRADEALYRAKDNGRNRVELWR